MLNFLNGDLLDTEQSQAKESVLSITKYVHWTVKTLIFSNFDLTFLKQI